MTFNLSSVRHTSWRSLVCLLFALLLAGGAMAAGHEIDESAAGDASAQADDGADGSAPAQRVSRYSELVPELTTTARRTEENLLEVPLSITAFSKQQLEEAGIASIADVAANTPGFSFVDFLGQELSRPVVRGVAPLDIFGESNTAVYIDGIFVSSDEGINFGYLDVERIEVMKGPQGAQFGNAAFSGAVNFVTQDPTETPSLNTEFQFGDNGKRTVKASVSGPLVEGVLGGRIGGMYDEYDGAYGNAAGLSQDIDGFNYKVLSGSLMFTPTDTLSAKLNLYLSDDTIDPPAQSTVSANCEPSLSTALPPFGDNGAFLAYCGKVPSIGKNDLKTIPGETGQIRKVVRTSLKVDWDTDIGVFSSLTGVSSTKDKSLQNGTPGADSLDVQYVTTTPSPVAGFLIDTFDLGGLLITNAGYNDVQDFSQELRFTSPTDKRARFSAGLFAYQKVQEIPNTRFSLLANGTLPADFGTFCPACFYITPTDGVSTIPIGDSLYLEWLTATEEELVGYTTTDTNDYAVFGSVEYDFTDRLTGYAETRYTKREQKLEDSDQFGNPVPVLQDFVPVPAVEIENEYVTWRGSLQWAIDDASNVYASIARGQKGGGVDFFEISGTGTALDDQITAEEFKPEKNLTYELGYKAALAEGRVVLDAAVFLIDWKDLVLRAVLDELQDGTPIQPVGVNQNAGDAEIKGFELGVRAQLSDNVNWGFGASYNDAELTRGASDRYEDFPSFGPEGDMTGKKLPRQPELQLNTNITFRSQFRGEWDWFVRGDAFYQSKWYAELPNLAAIDGRVRANARIGLESDRYTIELWSTNVFDDNTPDAAFRDPYFSNITQDGSATPKFFPWRMSIAQPERRAIGVRVIGRFGG